MGFLFPVGDDPSEHLRKVQARLKGRCVEAGVRREAGIRIHFEDPGAALPVDAEVYAGITESKSRQHLRASSFGAEQGGVCLGKFEGPRRVVELEDFLPLGRPTADLFRG